MSETLYIGKRKVYKTTNASVLGIPKEIFELLNTKDITEVKIFYDIKDKCMKIFFDKND